MLQVLVLLQVHKQLQLGTSNGEDNLHKISLSLSNSLMLHASSGRFFGVKNFFGAKICFRVYTIIIRGLDFFLADRKRGRGGGHKSRFGFWRLPLSCHDTPKRFFLLFWQTFFKIFGKTITFLIYLGVYTPSFKIWFIFVEN